MFSFFKQIHYYTELGLYKKCNLENWLKIKIQDFQMEQPSMYNEQVSPMLFCPTFFWIIGACKYIIVQPLITLLHNHFYTFNAMCKSNLKKLFIIIAISLLSTLPHNIIFRRITSGWLAVVDCRKVSHMSRELFLSI